MEGGEGGEAGLTPDIGLFILQVRPLKLFFEEQIDVVPAVWF